MASNGNLMTDAHRRSGDLVDGPADAGTGASDLGRGVNVTAMRPDTGTNTAGRFRSAETVDPLRWNDFQRWIAARGHVLKLPEQPQQFMGGLANCNYLVEFDGVAHVLRCPPAGPLPIGANDMEREYRILSRLGKHFPVAPDAPLYCADTDVIGRPFLLIEYRDGVIVRDTLPQHMEGKPAVCDQLADNMIDVLARLHALSPSDVGLQDLGRPSGMVARQAKNWARRATEAFGGRLPANLASIATWLERPAPSPQRTSLLHCDFKLNNIILAPHSLKPVALLDWDMGTLGDPLFDVATLLSYWAEPDDHPAMLALGQMPTAYPGFPTRAQVLDTYAQKSGVSVREFGYYRILALFKLCVVFQQLLVRYQRGGSKDPRGATFPALIAGLIDFTALTLSAERP